MARRMRREDEEDEEDEEGEGERSSTGHQMRTRSQSAPNHLSERLGAEGSVGLSASRVSDSEGDSDINSDDFQDAEEENMEFMEANMPMDEEKILPVSINSKPDENGAGEAQYEALPDNPSPESRTRNVLEDLSRRIPNSFTIMSPTGEKNVAEGVEKHGEDEDEDEDEDEGGDD